MADRDIVVGIVFEMRVRSTDNGKKSIGIFPMLLVLLLAVRVAASPAIQCQHELAAQTARTAQAVTGIPYSVGDLCGLPLVGDDSEHDENVLNSLCPFFMAPGILPASEVAIVASDQVYSWNWPLPAAVRPDSDAAIAGYEARAPPIAS